MLRHFDVSANSTTMLRHFRGLSDHVLTNHKLNSRGLTKQGNSEMANLEMGEIREQFF